MNETFTRKLIAALIVFMILFSHSAFTMEAIASSGDFHVIGGGLFSTDVIKYKVYPSGGTEKQNEIVTDVNNHAFLTIELNPKVDGYLRDGIIRAVDLDGNNLGFKIVNVTAVSETKTETAVNIAESEDEDVTRIDVVEENVVQDVVEVTPVEPEVIEPTPVEPEVTPAVKETTNTTVEKVENTVENIVEETKETSNTTETENVVEDTGKSTMKLETQGRKLTLESEQLISPKEPAPIGVLDGNKNFDVTESNAKIDNEIAEEEDPEEVAPSTEIEEGLLVDQDKLAESKSKQESIKDLSLTADVKVISDSEIQLKNVIASTTLTVEIEYVQNKEMTTRDAYKEVAFQLSGTFINEDLKEVEVGKEESLKIGWTQNQDIELTSEYTKVSPFEIGENLGTIVESSIKVKRVCDKNYLPVVKTTVEVDMPEFKGKLPTDVTVFASKLLLTRGEDIGSAKFDITNWSVNGNKLTIVVDNDIDGRHVVSNGEDEYVVVYRYEDYTDDITSRLGQNVTATVVQLNAKDNSTYIKNVSKEQEIKIDANELVTYSVNSSEDKIEKSKIYANYNNDQAIYDTEYKTEVNVNVLTSDLLKELKVQDYKEYYKDVHGNLFRAEGIIYKTIKFNYSDLKNILSNGGGIEIYNQDGVLLYTLVNDLVNDEEDAIVQVNSLGGCYIVAKDIATNGRINFEITKAITKCNYEKAAFKNFVQMESVINAEIKYEGIEDPIKLDSKKTSKLFDDSYTKANLVLSKPTLTTLQTNEDVEVKIELNNDKENSDLYVNPVFELVFPKYVKEVSVDSINLLFDNGLTIGDVETYNDDGLVKLRIALNGAQTTFSDSKLSNGTNILLNLNIKLDEYTPAKEDQIKLFYYNEGVANYQAQTKWKLDKVVPTGLLKTTNGFDVALIKYQAPSGLVAINGIINYDGQNSELSSVKKGKVTAEVGIGQESKIASMEVLVLNNTENECSDVIMLGRVPFIGNRAVITNEDLGTTVNAVMMEHIEENVQNPNTSDIYYSTNAEATKDLNDPNNGWTKTVDNFNEVRSYMIVVKGNLSAGAVQRYLYNFEIPANLSYDTSIAGSFGAYYTDNTNVGAMEQTSQADIVALTTKQTPKVNVTMFVEEGEGTEVREAGYLHYIVKVENNGGVDAHDVTLNVPNPTNGVLMTFYEKGASDFAGYDEMSGRTSYHHYDVIKAGETITENILVRVNSNVDDDQYVEAKANLKVVEPPINIDSNIVRNKVVSGYVQTSSKLALTDLNANDNTYYMYTFTNITNTDFNKVEIEITFPEELEYKKIETQARDFKYDSKYDESSRKLTITVDKLEANKSILFNIFIRAVKGSNEEVSPDAIIRINNIEEKILPVPRKIHGGVIIAEIEKEPSSNVVLEQEKLDYTFRIKNVGTESASNVTIQLDVSENLVKTNAVLRSADEVLSNRSLDDTGKGIFVVTIKPNQELELILSGQAAEINGEEKTIEHTLSVEYRDAITDTVKTKPIVIKANPGKEVKTVDPGTAYTPKNTVKQPTQSQTAQQPTQTKTNSNTNTNNNTSTKQETKAVVPTYRISGTAWLDLNRDGIRDGEEKELSGVEVQLINNGNMVKVTTTDKKGNYTFTEVPNGKYTIVFNYDGKTFIPTKYNKNNVDEAFTSNVIESKEGSALTNEIKVENGNVGNINLGLQYRDNFDISINKYAVKGTIAYGQKTEEYKFEDAQLAKLEIQAKKIKGAKVELVYKIVVNNVGNIDGYVNKIEDYVPDGMAFDQSKNPGWNIGTNGILYNETLKDQLIKVGEKKELTLVLTKEMNEENTGVSCNKVKISELNNQKGLEDINDNNVNTQETLILIKTGYTPQIASVVFFILLAATVVGVKYKDKLQNIFKKKVIK